MVIKTFDIGISIARRGNLRKGDRGIELKVTRVVLAEDHPKVRAGIRTLLEKASDIEVVGEAGDGEEALRLIDEVSPDVLLLDLEMPLMNGFEVARRLQEEGSPVKILVLSAYHDRQYVHRIREYGAAVYLTKEEAPEKIVRAVRGIAQDG
jgi:DNA-binding NarL/FixJ family response regulator